MTQMPSPETFSAATLDAVREACRLVPPAWPLTATVAVNPFLGHADEPLASLAARMERIGGPRPLMPRGWYRGRLDAGEITDADLDAAIAALGLGNRFDAAAIRHAAATDPAPAEALPTLADLVAGETGVDFPAIAEDRISTWAQAYFDEGQAMWRPARSGGAFMGWREFATHDLVPDLAGLKGFCRKALEAPREPDRAILVSLGRLGVGAVAARSYCHQLLLGLEGWAQLARLPGWQAERSGGLDMTLHAMLAARLLFEEALADRASPAVLCRWKEIVDAHAEPVETSDDIVIDCVLQTALEAAHRRRVSRLLEAGPADRALQAPAVKAFFCIDVRSEVFRRALESVSPRIETGGFAGFFGLDIRHRGFASDVAEHRLPVLLSPRLRTHETAPEARGREASARIAARARRALARFSNAAVASFAYVEAAGLGYAARLAASSLGLKRKERAAPPPRLDPALDAAAKVEAAANILRAMSLTQDFPPLVLLVGHGAGVVNNPFASALHCGACGGHAGDVNARLLAMLLNDRAVREGLRATGIDVPATTVFLAGTHDTTSDAVTLYEDGHPVPPESLARLRDWLGQAAFLARTERAARLPGAHGGRDVARRGADWSELRPEWGLAGCAAFIAAPRSLTRGRALDGRAFLHDYDWTADTGFGVLELILTAPVVVASWISLQYYGSTVAPAAYGSGDKLLHNVVGGIGVLEGNAGHLRTGLPWQSVHDGRKLVHDPLRLTVFVAAPTEGIGTILARHDEVRALFDNGWLALVALDDAGRPKARYSGGLAWTAP